MKLVLVNNDPHFEVHFKKYVSEWGNEEAKPNEDYYGMYKKVFKDYAAFTNHLVALRDSKRLEEGKPYVRFYWFLKNHNEIVGTIRYRLNIPEEFGNLGYEISPKHRNKGYGRKMLAELIKQLKAEKVGSVLLTLSQDNLASEKIIELNGGIFLKLLKSKESNMDLKLYEIVLK